MANQTYTKHNKHTLKCCIALFLGLMYIYTRTQAKSAKRYCLLFANSSNHRDNSGIQINAVTWRTVTWHAVPDVFHSKKSFTALLVYELMNCKHHKSDAYQVAIQLLVVTTIEEFIRTLAVSAKRLNVNKDIYTYKFWIFNKE